MNRKQSWVLSRSYTDQNFSSVLQLKRSNFVQPWRDNKYHFHTSANELFLVLNGELWLMVEDLPIRMQKETVLVVQPNVAHAVVGGTGLIQHYVMQISNEPDEKKICSDKLPIFESSFQDQNQKLDPLKGFFADLREKENHNWWLIGTKNKYLSKDYCFAYIILNNEEDVKKTGHQDSRHYHTEATEWYWTFEGKQEIEVAGEIFRVTKNQLLRVEKQVPHNLISRVYPFRGLTMRTSIRSDKKIVLER